MSPVPPPGGPGDALHRDETIPVLTDVIRLPRDPEPEPVAQAFSDDDWAALAARVETSVTERMLLHAGPMLDASLDSMLTNLLQRAGAPTRPEALGLGAEEIALARHSAHYLRNRFTIRKLEIALGLG